MPTGIDEEKSGENTKLPSSIKLNTYTYMHIYTHMHNTPHKHLNILYIGTRPILLKKISITLCFIHFSQYALIVNYISRYITR